MALTRKSRHITDLYEEMGMGEMTIWIENKPGFTVSSKQTKRKPVDVPVPGAPRGYQITDSENHTDWGRPNRPDSDKELKLLYQQAYTGVAATFGKGDPPSGPVPYDVGGDFFSQKVTIHAVNPSEQFITGRVVMSPSYDWCASYRGPIMVRSLYGLPFPPSIQGDLNAAGATAIARCSPTNNIASAANFLRELRTEGLPKLFGLTLLKKRAQLANAVGDEYLNTEFGWKPLVSDVKAIAYCATHAHEILSQYERDSGKVVRRRYYFPEEETQSDTVIGDQNGNIGDYSSAGFSPTYPGGDPIEILRYGAAGSTVHRLRQTWKKVWFSGAFTYHLPVGYNARNELVRSARHAQTLLNLDITPENLWNAAPWTWAIDWFSNAGDVVANLSDWATDGLVLKYGYVMEHTIVTDTYYAVGRGRFSDKRAQPSPIVFSVETKRRVKASPFGFGFTWSGLSLRQKAISVALGLTKGIKH